jgi:two-component system, LytTR family, sensor kinase
MGRTIAPKLRTYAIIFLAWTFLGLFLLTQDLTRKLFSHDPSPWWDYLLSWLTGAYICAALTPAILWLGRRFPIERKNWARRVTLHLLFSVLFAVLVIAFDSAILPHLRIFPSFMKTSASTFALLMILSFHQNVLSYWTILGIQCALRYYHAYQERERQALRLELHASELKTQLTRAQLGALKMQLQPHFLFNTLNAIMVLVRQQRGAQAEEMLARLSDLLRCVLDEVAAQEVPLRRELEYLQLYLSIEQVRFQDRLRVEISANPIVLDAAVPQLILQPIVENAIRHGIARSSAAGQIRISASRTGDTLEIDVQDDGPGFPAAHLSNTRGIGLANTRARLEQLYGDAARLIINNGERHGALVTILLPYRVAPASLEPEMIATHATHHPNS